MSDGALAAIRRVVGEQPLPLPEPFDPCDDGHLDLVAAPLLHRFREHDDTSAFALLVELTQARVSRIAHQVARQLAMAIDPEDLVASFFARLFTDVRKQQPIVLHFLGLARTALRNDALNQLRQYRRAQARHAVWGEQRLLEKVADPAAEAEDNEQILLLRRLGTVFLSVVGQCFHELTERDRRVLLAREVDQLTYDGIAESLSVPRSQVGMMVKRAREHLTQRIRATFTRTDRAPAAPAAPAAPPRPTRTTRATREARTASAARDAQVPRSTPDAGIECAAPRGAPAGQEAP